MSEQFQQALRLQKLPPYLFAEIDKKKNELIKNGKDLIDLGVGDPDLPTPTPIIKALAEAAKDPSNHRYPSYSGMNGFKKVCADWLERRFSVLVDPDQEVISVIGSKEGIANFTLSIVNPGDFTLVPDPSYPVYANATILAGGTSIYYPLTYENQFQPDWSKIPDHVWKTIKLVYINYPNNPTSALIPLEKYAELVDRAKRFGFYILSDGAYCEQGYRNSPPCALQVPGAKDVVIEFFSLSKTYNMTGWRVGFAAGAAHLVSALGAMKSNVDSGIFQPIQKAAISALSGKDEELIHPSKEVYLYRRKLMLEGLQKRGYEVFDGGATFYLWIKNPTGKTSSQIAASLLEHGVVVTPGSGFGKQGEGFFRIALTVPEEKIREALERFPNC